MVKQRYKYPRKVVSAIKADIDYYLLFFAGMSIGKKDVLYLHKFHKNGDITMKCPFHKERTPSFRVNAKNNIFKCFGCGQCGNFITLLAKFHNVYYVTAIKMALKIKYPNFSVVENPLQKKLLIQTQKVYSDNELDFPF